jgi:hypothetical protein
MGALIAPTFPLPSSQGAHSARLGRVLRGKNVDLRLRHEPLVGNDGKRQGTNRKAIRAFVIG